MSRTIRGAFGNEPVSKMIAVESVEREEGLRRMDRGEASALLIVPKGFQNAYFRNQPVQLQLVENPAQRILPKIIEEMMLFRRSEREGRVIDYDQDGSMEIKKREGYV